MASVQSSGHAFLITAWKMRACVRSRSRGRGDGQESSIWAETWLPSIPASRGTTNRVGKLNPDKGERVPVVEGDPRKRAGTDRGVGWGGGG